MLEQLNADLANPDYAAFVEHMTRHIEIIDPHGALTSGLADDIIDMLQEHAQSPFMAMSALALALARFVDDAPEHARPMVRRLIDLLVHGEEAGDA
jgi:hypothetical protein